MKITKQVLEARNKDLQNTIEYQDKEIVRLRADYNRTLTDYTDELAALGQKNIALQYALQLMYHQVRDTQKKNNEIVSATAGFKFVDDQWINDDKLSLAQ